MQVFEVLRANGNVSGWWKRLRRFALLLSHRSADRKDATPLLSLPGIHGLLFAARKERMGQGDGFLVPALEGRGFYLPRADRLA